MPWLRDIVFCSRWIFISKIKGWKSSRFWCWPVASAARCPSPPAPPPCSSPAVAGCSDAALGCSRRLWTGCLLYSRNNREHTYMSQCHTTELRLCPLSLHSTHRSGSAVYTAVWYDLWKSDDPVVDLVSSSSFHCKNKWCFMRKYRAPFQLYMFGAYISA